MSEYTTRQILEMITAHGGAEGLDLTQRDFQEADLSRDRIQAEWAHEAEVNPEATPMWMSDTTGGVHLGGAHLPGANLRDAHLEGADVRSANLRGACLWTADLRGANLMRADLQGADLRGARLQETVLWEADLQGANLMRASLHGASLGTADLRGANLARADLHQADLRGARLQRASLRQADLHGADLRGAHLQGVDLTMADLTRVHFLDTIGLEGIHLYRAVLDNTQWTKDQLGEAIAEERWGEWFETITRNPLDLLSFSLETLTGREPAHLEARSTLTMRTLTLLENRLGLFLFGLLGFVAGHRIKRS